jgi:chemotaxis signal transduction protein
MAVIVLPSTTAPSDVDELLRRRAERLRQAPPAIDAEDVLPVAEFRVGDEIYALPLADLRAVLPLRLVTPVPLAQGALVGILRFEGRIIRALSLASMLGARGWQSDPRVLLVVAAGNEIVALDCEETPRPAALPMTAFEQAKSRASGPVLDVIAADGRELHVIQVQSLLRAQGGRHGG